MSVGLYCWTESQEQEEQEIYNILGRQVSVGKTFFQHQVFLSHYCCGLVSSVGVLIPCPLSGSSLNCLGLLRAEMIHTFLFHYPCILLGLLWLQEGYFVIPKINCNRISAARSKYWWTELQEQEEQKIYLADKGRAPVVTTLILPASSTFEQLLLCAWLQYWCSDTLYHPNSYLKCCGLMQSVCSLFYPCILFWIALMLWVYFWILIDKMSSSVNDAKKAQRDMDWELLGKLHMQRVTKMSTVFCPTESKNPLSYVVEKCFSYDPLIILGQCL